MSSFESANMLYIDIIFNKGFKMFYGMFAGIRLIHSSFTVIVSI